MDSIYHKIKPFPQLTNPAYKSWIDPWICERCIENMDDKTPCYFCNVRDGLMAKIKFANAEKKVAKKKPNEDRSYNWAHLNCILKLYAKVPPYEDESRSFMLDKDILADAPPCKHCGPQFKMDVRCNTCLKFYAHNLCWANEKMHTKLCSSCDNAENFNKKMGSNISGEYMHKFIQNIVQSGKFNCFTTKRGEREKPSSENGVEVIEEKRITDYYIKENDKRQRIFAFPHITKDMIYGDPTKPSEATQAKYKNFMAETGKQSKVKKENKVTYEFIIGNVDRPEYKLEVQVNKNYLKPESRD